MNFEPVDKRGRECPEVHVDAGDAFDFVDEGDERAHGGRDAERSFVEGAILVALSLEEARCSALGRRMLRACVFDQQ
jgi:hypothetical protein